MDKKRDQNLLFAVLAVQIKGVSPEKIMEAAAGWMINPETPLSDRVCEMNILRPEDVAILTKLVDDMVAACDGDASRALRSIPGGDMLGQSIVTGQPFTAAAGDHTRPMQGDFPLGFEDDAELSTLEEHPGRYSHVSEYGKGGMGRVLLVHDEFLGREIALKELLLPHEDRDDDTPISPVREAGGLLARFLQEARITGQLEHPSIVPVYELGKRVNGTFYYTMKLVRGKTLSRAIKEAFSLRNRLELLPSVLDLCQAIAYAHSRGVIHRDLKPANAMIGEFGETVLLDWGLAKIKGTKDVYAGKLQETLRFFKLRKPDETPQTHAGEALGTPHYMPPEQAKGEIEELDERSDVYSMGALIYEVLSGKPPFEGDTAEEILMKVVGEEPTPIAELEPDAPPELIAICRKAMAKDRQKRYRSMTELRDDLIRFQTGAFVQSYRYNLWETLTRYYERYRIWVNAGAVAALILIIMGAYSYVSILQARDREREQRLIAEAAQEEAAREAYVAQIRLAQAQINENAFDNAIDTLLTTSPEQREWEWGYLLNQASPEEYRLDMGSGCNLAYFSADGSRIIAMAQDGPDIIWRTADGSKVAELEAKPARLSALNFAPNATWAFGVTVSGIARIWDPDTGNLRHEARAVKEMAMHAQPSPFGPALLIASSGGEVACWDFEESATPTQIKSPIDSVYRVFWGRHEDEFLVCSRHSAALMTRGLAEPHWIIQGMEARFGPDKQSVYTFEENRVDIWSTETGERTRRVDTEPKVFRAHLSPDGRTIATLHIGDTLRLYDVDSGRLILEQHIVGSLVEAVFSPDSKLLAAIPHRRAPLTIWRTTDGKRMDLLPPHGQIAPRVAFSPDSRQMMTFDTNGTVRVWRVGQKSGELVTALQDGEIIAGEVSLNGSYAATTKAQQRPIEGSMYKTHIETSFLDLKDRRLTTTVLRHGLGTYESLSFSTDGSRAALVLDISTAVVIDTSTGAVIAYSPQHEGQIVQVLLSAEGDRLATVSHDGTCRIIDLNAGGQEKVLVGHDGVVTSVAFSGDGEAVVTGGIDKTVRLWRLQEDDMKIVGHHENMVTSVAFADGEDQVIATDMNEGVAIWDVETGQKTLQFHGKFGLGRLIGIHDETRRMLTSGHRDDPRVWTLDTGTELCVLNHTSRFELTALSQKLRILDATFGVNGETVHTVSSDGRVTNWISTPELISHASEDPDSQRSAYQRWKREAFANRPSTWEIPQVTSYRLFTSDLALKHAFHTLRDEVRAESVIRDQGLRIASKKVEHAVARICLQEGDVLSALDGVPITEPQDLARAFDAYLNGAPRANTPAFELTLVRDGRRLTFTIYVLPHHTTEIDVSLSREEALAAVRHEIAALQDNRTLIASTAKAYSLILGDTSPNGGMKGIWVIKSGNPEEAQFLQRFGVNVGDRIVSLGDVPITDMDALIAHYVNLEEQLIQGWTGNFTMMVERGEFQRLHINITVTN